MRVLGCIAIAIVASLLNWSVLAQTAGYVFPTGSLYTAGAGDNGKILASDNVTPSGTIEVDLPSPATVGAGWQMGFSEGGGRGITIVPPASKYILAGQKTLTTLSVPTQTNYEYLTLQSDGTNYRLLSVTDLTALANGLVTSSAGKTWTYLYSAGYAATAADNGHTLSSAFSGGPVTITLPSTPVLPNGWSTILYASTNGITVNTNAISGGSIINTSGGAVNTYTIGAPGFAAVSFDGASFRIVNLSAKAVRWSEYGVSATGTAAANTTAAQAAIDAAYAAKVPWLDDVISASGVPINQLLVYAYRTGDTQPYTNVGSALPGACVLASQAGVATFRTVAQPGDTTVVQQITGAGLGPLCIHGNGLTGANLLLEGVSYSHLLPSILDQRGTGTWSYYDGVATKSYPSMNLGIKAVSGITQAADNVIDGGVFSGISLGSQVDRCIWIGATIGSENLGGEPNNNTFNHPVGFYCNAGAEIRTGSNNVFNQPNLGFAGAVGYDVCTNTVSQLCDGTTLVQPYLENHSSAGVKNEAYATNTIVLNGASFGSEPTPLWDLSGLYTQWDQGARFSYRSQPHVFTWHQMTGALAPPYTFGSPAVLAAVGDSGEDTRVESVAFSTTTQNAHFTGLTYNGSYGSTVAAVSGMTLADITGMSAYDNTAFHLSNPAGMRVRSCNTFTSSNFCTYEDFTGIDDGTTATTINMTLRDGAMVPRGINAAQLAGNLACTSLHNGYVVLVQDLSSAPTFRQAITVNSGGGVYRNLALCDYSGAGGWVAQ